MDNVGFREAQGVHEVIKEGIAVLGIAASDLQERAVYGEGGGNETVSLCKAYSHHSRSA